MFAFVLPSAAVQFRPPGRRRQWTQHYDMILTAGLALAVALA
jgi:hypothetical protein